MVTEVASKAPAEAQPAYFSAEEEEEREEESCEEQAQPDLYELLGVPRDVKLPELQKAYRRQCIKTHPDKGGDRRTFDGVMKAFEILSDEDLRRAYDAMGHAGAEELRQGKKTIRGSIESILSFLESSPTIAEKPGLWNQCLSAIEDISRNDRDAKAWFLHADVLGRLGSLFEKLASFGWAAEDRMKVVQGFVKCMSELCCGQPAPSPSQLDSAWDCFAQALCVSNDSELIIGTLEGLTSVLKIAADEDEDEEGCHVARLICGGTGGELTAPGEEACGRRFQPMLTRVLSRLWRPAGRSEQELSAALGLLASLVAMPAPEPTDAIIAAGAAGALLQVLTCSAASSLLRRAAVGVLAAAAAHVQGQQACRLLEEPGLWEALCSTAETAGVRKLRHECLRAVASIAKHGSVTLRKLDCHRLLRLVAVSLADSPGVPVLWGLLEAVEACLHGSGDRTLVASRGALVQTAGESGLLGALPRLLDELPQSSEVRRKALRILEACSSQSAGCGDESPGGRRPQDGGA